MVLRVRVALTQSRTTIIQFSFYSLAVSGKLRKLTSLGYTFVWCTTVQGRTRTQNERRYWNRLYSLCTVVVISQKTNRKHNAIYLVVLAQTQCTPFTWGRVSHAGHTSPNAIISLCSGFVAVVQQMHNILTLNRSPFAIKGLSTLVPGTG